ncbi:MAG: 4-hydroxy-3-methylbut-2-enyl diphosphate reductase [Candidatus Zixiibacteriota bacterium]
MSVKRIVIDEDAGPCGGVKRVIKLSEQNIAQGFKTASLGPVVHNSNEISRLESLGLEAVDYSEFDRVESGGEKRRVVIRAHGEAPEVFERAEKLGLEVVDGTCPVVVRSQKFARKYYDRGYQVVVIGKPNHAEVIGIVGHCNHEAKVVHDEADTELLDPDRPTYVLAQTTISEEMFNSMLAAVRKRVKHVVHRNTICAFVSDREDELRIFAAEYDVILFVGGRNSSNTGVMHQVCLSVNPRSYWIESIDDVDLEWFDNAESVGISGSASTPQWLLEKVGQDLAERLQGERALQS